MRLNNINKKFYKKKRKQKIPVETTDLPRQIASPTKVTYYGDN